MSSDASEPEEDRSVGLKLVDAKSESGISPDASRSTPGTAPTRRQGDRRSLPGWLWVVALILSFLLIAWQARVASELEAEVAGLEAQLELTRALLDAHRTRLSEIRGGVYELSERLQDLRALVDIPMIEGVPGSVVPTP